MSYRIAYMYHPTIRVRSREESAEFFQRVFGRPSVKQEDFANKWSLPGYPTNYCIWTMVSDCWIDCVFPPNYVIDGKQIIPTMNEPGQLSSWGWYVDNMQELYTALKKAGAPMLDHSGQAPTGDRVPSTIATDKFFPLFLVNLDGGGLRYEFVETPTEIPGAATDQVPGIDVRRDPEWTVPPVSDSDPLGIERTSHHTVLTSDIERAKHLLIDLLKGKIVHESENRLLGTESIWIAIGQEVFEYAVPKREDTVAWADWTDQVRPGSAHARNRKDTYHAITFKVRDLDKAAKHLTDVGVKIAARDDSTVIVDPATALGVPWGFTSANVGG